LRHRRRHGLRRRTWPAAAGVPKHLIDQAMETGSHRTCPAFSPRQAALVESTRPVTTRQRRRVPVTAANTTLRAANPIDKSTLRARRPVLVRSMAQLIP
jgi:hypothetical protein